MPPIKYTQSNDVCPYVNGMQNLEGISRLIKTAAEPSGYCSAWSMFFTELCLKNPEIPSSVLLDNIYDKLVNTENAADYLKKVIRGYAGLIYEKFTKMLSVFFKEKVTIGMINVLRNSKNISDRVKASKASAVLNMLIDLEIKKLDPAFDSKTVKNCKANEIINTKTGKCMRITTMIKQIVKNNKLALKESDIDFFIDVAREKKLTLGSEREITAALNILLNSGIFKSK